jgi:hypothetical protein
MACRDSRWVQPHRPGRRHTCCRAAPWSRLTTHAPRPARGGHWLPNPARRRGGCASSPIQGCRVTRARCRRRTRRTSSATTRSRPDAVRAWPRSQVTGPGLEQLPKLVERPRPQPVRVELAAHLPLGHARLAQHLQVRSRCGSDSTVNAAARRSARAMPMPPAVGSNRLTRAHRPPGRAPGVAPSGPWSASRG